MTLLLRNRQFRTLLLGQATSDFGNQMYALALLWSMQSLTHGWKSSAIWMSLMLIAALIPQVVIGPIAGVLIDRWPKVRTLATVDIVRFLLVGGLTLLVRQHSVTPVMLIGFNFVLSTVGTIFNPGIRVIQKSIASDEDMVQLNSTFTTANRVSVVAGPAIGGLIIGFAGMTSVYAVDALTFLVSVLSLLLLRPMPQSPRAQEKLTLPRLFGDAKGGLQAILDVPFARIFTPFILLYNFSAVAFEYLVVLYVANVLHFVGGSGAELVGTLNSAMGLGEIAGGLLLTFITRRIAKERLIALCITVASLSILTIGLIRSVPFIIALFFLGGLATVLVQIIFFSGIQQVVPADATGRVFAWLGAVFSSVTPLAQLAFGALAVVIPVDIVVILMGALGTSVGVTTWFSNFVRESSRDVEAA